MARGILLIAALVTLSVTGCAYRLGNTGPSYGTTIGIARVVNSTDEPRAGIYAAEKLRTAFVVDGTLKLVDPQYADIVIEPIVAGYQMSTAGSAKLSSTDEQQEIYTTSIWRATVDLSYKVTKRLKPLAEGEEPVVRNVQGTAEFTDLIDTTVVRKDGIRQALHDAVQKVVADVIDGDW